MKLMIVLICFVGLLSSSGKSYSQNTKLSVEFRSSTIESVLNYIESRTDYSFMYDNKKIDILREVNISVKDKTVEAILDQIFDNRVTYKVIGKHIIITPKDEQSNIAIVADQSRTISGRVTDSLGQPLPGVTVVIKGQNKGTITDSEGKFTLANVPADGTLSFSFVGMKGQDVKVSGKSTINVSLVEETVGIDEVVAVGYATQKREAVTGSIASVQGKELVRTPVAGSSNALVGLLPGLVANQAQGVPGGDASSLSIRGFGNALVIVDGIETDFNNIDPSAIESISILKDGSAAIYGSRAGNGVILVTLKRGTNQKPTISLNSSVTLMGNTMFPRPASSGQCAEMAREAHIQSGKPISTAPFTEEEIQKYYDGTDPNYPNTDWFSVLMRSWTPMKVGNISIRGGSEKAKYYTYLGYTDQPTFFKKNGGGYKRYNAISNLDAQITNNLSVGLDLSTIVEKKDMPNMNFTTGSESGWLQIWGMDPMGAASYPDATKVPFNHQEAHVLTNRNLGGYNDTDSQILKGALSINYDLRNFISGLSVKYYANYMRTDNSNKQWYNPVDYYDYDYDTKEYKVVGHFGGNGSLSQSYNKATTFTNQISLMFDRVFNEAHHVKALVLCESIDYKDENFGASRKDFVSSLVQQLYAGSTDGQNIWGSASEMGRKSVVSRVNYSYKDKYLIESSFRADASAKFPKDSRWGYFPSVSLGWNIAREDFMKDFKSLDNLKLRISQGNSGNDNVANFDYLAGYSLGYNYLFGNTSYQTIESTGLANPYLTWEKIKISNIGVDFSFFNKKLYGEADVFYRERKGIPATKLLTLDPSFGASLPPVNLNSLNDRGFELKLGTAGVIGDFTYNLNGNISWSRAKWQHYEEPDYTDPDDIRLYKKSGKWVDRTFGYRSNGLFTSQSQINNLTYDQDKQGNISLRPGDVQILDTDGSGKVDYKDQVLLGAGHTPHWMAGLDISLKYRNFDFNTLIQGAFNYTTQVAIPRALYPYTPSYLLYKLRWTEENNDPNALVSRLGGVSDGSGSDYVIKDAGYMRLKNFSIGYSVPKIFLDRMSIKQARIYFAGTNVFTLSKLNKYKLDPEAPTGAGGYYYPQQKTFSIGINVSF